MALTGIVISVLIANWVLLLTGVMSLYMLFTGRNALTRPQGKVDRQTKLWTAFNLVCSVVAASAGVMIVKSGDPSGGRFAFPTWFIDMRLNLVPITVVFGVLIYWVVNIKWG